MKYLRGVIRAVLALAAAIILCLCIRRWCVGTVRVAGASMADTLCSGDVVLVSRFDYSDGRSPRRGHVVECRFPGRSDTYIKRVVGLPGDEIAFFGGALTVNGSVVPEPYVSSGTGDYSIRLGDDEYLVLGDNRAESYDSRMEDMGPIDSGAFTGRVRFVIWPIQRIGAIR